MQNHNALNPLFADQNWMHIRVRQSGYTYDGYLDDLQKAWDTADHQCRQQIEAGEPPTALIDCFRLLLIRTSINTLVASYPPNLIASAVEVGIWTVERAWSVAKRTQRVEVYAALLSTGKLTAEQRAELISDGYQ